MLDDLHPDEHGDDEKRAPAPRRKLSDREVPLVPHQSTVLADTIHAWLDGELPERNVRRADWSHDVDFWNRINDDLDSRRRMRTPAHVQDRIMRAIPQHAPQLITPWWRREFVVTPSAALLTAAALMALASAATAIGMR
jgi:hypothetical protein